MNNTSIEEKYYVTHQCNKIYNEEYVHGELLIHRNSSNVSDLSKSDMFDENLSNIALDSPNLTTSDSLSIDNQEESVTKNEDDNMQVELRKIILKEEFNLQLNPSKEQKLVYILNKSNELREDSSTASSTSNAKFLRTTVEEIFNNFHANMQDFESYKNKFRAILSRDNTNVACMRHFLNDIVHHIRFNDNDNNVHASAMKPRSRNTSYETCDVKSFISNTNTYTVSSANRTSMKSSSSSHAANPKGDIGSKSSNNIVDETFNIRSLTYESMKNGSGKHLNTKVLSADNVNRHYKKSSCKNSKTSTRSDKSEKVIAINSSTAKRSLSTNAKETQKCDVTTQKSKSECDTSIIHRFCSYFCKMFRKSM